MIWLIFAAMIILTLLFTFASQYFIGNIYIIIGYGITMLLGCFLCITILKLRHHREIKKLMDFLEDTTRVHNYQEEGLSSLEHKIQTLVKSNALISDQVTRERDHINAIISDVAHQSKTPLSNIIMYADFLLESDQNNRAYVKMIRDQGEKLRFLFDAMIKMSRCERGLVTGNLNCKKHNIKDLIASAVSDIYLAANEKQITIYTDCSSELSGYFDMKWTGEALFNILDNGVKYAPHGSDILITGIKHDMFVCIQVRDEGPGIDEYEQPSIWKRFYRGTDVAEEKGVGIGLYLAKQILYSEHGYIKVKSELGKGSTFSIYLPVNETIKSDETVRFEKYS